MKKKYCKGITIETFRRRAHGRVLEVVLTNDKPYGQGFRQAIIWYRDGEMLYNITDGYDWLLPNKPIRNYLKSAVNIVAGYLV